MTKEQRSATRNALANYGQRGFRQSHSGFGWCLAIEQAQKYYQTADPQRANLLQLRYLEHRTVEDTMERLCMGYSTYQKAHTDLLSTIAIYAAHNGVL